MTSTPSTYADSQTLPLDVRAARAHHRLGLDDQAATAARMDVRAAVDCGDLDVAQVALTALLALEV